MRARLHRFGQAGGVGNGEQHLIEVPHGVEKIGAAAGIQFAQHIVEQQQRLVTRLRLNIRQFGELERERDGALLTTRAVGGEVDRPA